MERLTRDDAKAQHARLFAKDVLRVVIVGDIDKRAAAQILDFIFGNLLTKAQLAHLARAEPRALRAPVVINQDQPLDPAAVDVADELKDQLAFEPVGD